MYIKYIHIYIWYIYMDTFASSSVTRFSSLKLVRRLPYPLRQGFQRKSATEWTFLCANPRCPHTTGKSLPHSRRKSSFYDSLPRETMHILVALKELLEFVWKSRVVYQDFLSMKCFSSVQSASKPL